jgi:CRISPR-associated protein Cas1
MQSNLIEITGSGKYLSKHRGFLVVNEDQSEIGKVPLDDISSLICSADGMTISNKLIESLLERKASIVFCDSKYQPNALVHSLVGHFDQTLIFEKQAAASLPLKKNLWKEIIKQKIRSQGEVLTFLQVPNKLNLYVERVKTDDNTNEEAKAAKRYWTLLFGKDFTRDRTKAGLNSLLNYGYIVLRSLVARLTVSNGLHPSLGLHHKNKRNSMCLVDDLIEPFRPLVDILVFKMYYEQDLKEVNSETKSILSNITVYDLSLSMPQKSNIYSLINF